MFKHTIPTFLRVLFPKLTWRVKTRDKEVFLTFDDGPHPHITTWVLQQLRQYNAKATFFCVGQNAQRYPEIVTNITHAGHQLGNHTMQHVSGWSTNNNEYIQDIEACAHVLPSRLFRPPYGRITPKQIGLVQRLGYQIIMWDVLTRDYDSQLNVQKAYAACMQHIQPGSVVVFHDSEKAEKQLYQLLPLLLAHLSQRGYRFAALPG